MGRRHVNIAPRIPERRKAAADHVAG